MSGLLDNSPAEVVRKLLINLGLGTDPDLRPQHAWPIYVSAGPDTADASNADKDSFIIVEDEGDWSRSFDRDAVQQYRIVNHGIKVTVKGKRHTAGYVKANAIAVGMDSGFYRARVTIGSVTYLVESIMRTGDVEGLGKEKPQATTRRTFTINGLVTLEKL